MTAGIQVFYTAVNNSGLIKDNILKQAYKIGDSLGTEQELAEMYGVSRVTVRKALELLKEEGIIESRRGSGNRIVSVQYKQAPGIQKKIPSLEILLPKPWEVLNSVAAVDIVGMSAEQASWFHVDQGTDVYRVQHMRYINDRPLGYISTYYPMALTPGLEHMQVTVPVSRYVMRMYGLKFDRREDLFIADVARFKEMQYLDVALGDPILCNVRFRYGKDQLIEVSEYKLNARIARFRYANSPDIIAEEE